MTLKRVSLCESCDPGLDNYCTLPYKKVYLGVKRKHKLVVYGAAISSLKVYQKKIVQHTKT